jgi:hypothetical protein
MPPRIRSARVGATFTRLKSGSWRVQVRRKGKYVNNSFLLQQTQEAVVTVHWSATPVPGSTGAVDHWNTDNSSDHVSN